MSAAKRGAQAARLLPWLREQEGSREMLLCPLCARSLKTVERDGVEIDHCTGCGGFWLDQGELDRLVKQEAQIALQAGQQALSLARRNREYDHAAVSAEERDSTGGMTGATGANRVLREAAAAVSARF